MLHDFGNACAVLLLVGLSPFILLALVAAVGIPLLKLAQGVRGWVDFFKPLFTKGD